MKKYISIVLCVIFALLLVSCAKGNADKIDNKEDILTVTEAVENSKNKDEINPDLEYNGTPGIDTNYVTSDTLICYFSCTGATAQIASYISNSTGGDMFEIIPKLPYTIDDLDYSNNESRSYTEDKNNDSRPEMISHITSWESYKTVYIGYPIWYGNAPKIIYTFMDNYDCSGKKIIPFCTSDSTDITQSVNNLKQLCPNANWQKGTRFSRNTTETDINNWIN